VIGVHNVTGGFVAVVLLLVLLIRRPILAILLPLSLIVLVDHGVGGVVLLWSVVVLLHELRGRGRQPAPR
jgi:hypothetical protein